MLTATIILLGRATVGEDFSELWRGSTPVGDGTAIVRPAVPPAAAGHELVVEVRAAGGAPNFSFFVEVPGEPVEGKDAAAAPPAPQLVPFSSDYFAAGAQTKARRVPFQGGVIALCRVGRPQLSA